MRRTPTNRVELLQGTLDMLVLRALLFGPLHGHAIATHIERTSEVIGYRVLKRFDLYSARRSGITIA